MPLYTNIDGTSKNILSLPCNINGSTKNLETLSANISGTSKNIFEATKYHWWKKYTANQWKEAYITSKYDSDTDSTSSEAFSTSSCWGFETHYAYRNYSINSSNGRIYLTNPVLLTWTKETTGEGTAFEKDNYTLNNASTSSPLYISYIYNTTNGDISLSQRDEIYQIYSGYAYSMSNGGTQLYATAFDYNKILYPVPKSYNSSAYTLVSNENKNSYLQLCPSTAVTGTGYNSYYNWIGKAGAAGYDVDPDFEDPRSGSSSVIGDCVRLRFSGDYYEYEGYHA